jgi:class 3 adenylate cyclase
MNCPSATTRIDLKRSFATSAPNASAINRLLGEAASRTRRRRRPMEACAAVDGERKTITALFADIKGSVELIEGLDPEEARAVVDPALQLMMDAVHRYEGYVAQSRGDGIFALFRGADRAGRPRAARVARKLGLPRADGGGRPGCGEAGGRGGGEGGAAPIHGGVQAADCARGGPVHEAG